MISTFGMLVMSRHKNMLLQFLGNQFFICLRTIFFILEIRSKFRLSGSARCVEFNVSLVSMTTLQIVSCVVVDYG